MIRLQEFMIPFYKKIKILNRQALYGKVILITGSNGLIGGNILTFLNYLSEKNDLNLSIIAVRKSKKNSWLPNTKRIKYIEEDLSFEKSKSLSRPFDYVIHAATYAQPKKFLAGKKQTVILNINTLFNILEQAKKNKAKVLYISSSEIYGETSIDKLVTEDFFGKVNTLSDRAIYAESKRLAESICYSYRNDINIKIARLLLSYGPGIKKTDERVYSEFIRKAHSTGKIAMIDAGLAKRNFCFITDAVEMLINIMISGKEFVYNVAGVDTTTISVLAKKIAKINKAEFIGYRENKKKITGTPKNSVISNQRYRKEFKKKKFVSLTEGLKSTSAWYKNLK